MVTIAVYSVYLIIQLLFQYRQPKLICLCVVFVLSGKVLTSIEDSHVFKMLQEDQERPHQPRQSGSFKALQDYVESDGKILEHLSCCQLNSTTYIPGMV